MKLLGKLLLSYGALTTAIVPYLADWSSRHTFGPGWSKHARFHGVANIFGSTALGLMALWLIWFGKPEERNVRINVAALIPIFHWATFDLSLVVPTTSPDDDERKVPRVFGAIPINVFVQNLPLYSF